MHQYEDLRKDYVAICAVDEDTCFNKQHGILLTVDTLKPKSVNFIAYCTRCGEMFTVVAQKNNKFVFTHDIVCPKCNLIKKVNGTSFSIIKDGKGNLTSRPNFDTLSYDVSVCENTSLLENDLLIRFFLVQKHYCLRNGYHEKIYEHFRYFAGKKQVYYRRTGANAKYKKSNCSYLDRAYSYTTQSIDEICHIINRSYVSDSGLDEYYKLPVSSHYRGRWLKNPTTIKYLNAWYKKPIIKELISPNLTNLLDDLILHIDELDVYVPLNKNKKSLNEVIDVSQKTMEIIMLCNLDARSIRAIKEREQNDEKISVDDVKAIIEMIGEREIPFITNKFKEMSIAEIRSSLEKHSDCLENLYDLDLRND